MRVVKSYGSVIETLPVSIKVTIMPMFVAQSSQPSDLVFENVAWSFKTIAKRSKGKPVKTNTKYFPGLKLQQLDLVLIY